MNTLDYIVKKYDLHIYRRYPIEIPNVGRKDLAALFAELGFTSGAEIGVQRADYSRILCKANPNLKLKAIDPWVVHEGYRDLTEQRIFDENREIAFYRMRRYPNCEIVQKFSLDAVKDFPDNSLDFVYIDANHELPAILLDIIAWSKKVRPGGIVSGHDYYKSDVIDTRCHVLYAVDCYTQAFRIRPWFLLGTKEEVPGQVRDKPRSWMWVKRET